MTALSKILLPCPFCASPAEEIVGSHNFRDVMIRCVSCSAEGPLFDADDASVSENQIAAQRHWNTRTKSKNASTTKGDGPRRALLEALGSAGEIQFHLLPVRGQIPASLIRRGYAEWVRSNPRSDAATALRITEAGRAELARAPAPSP
jgi:hypothetical protein